MINHRTVKQLHTFINAVINMSVVTLFFSLFMILGPVVESKYLPVVEKMDFVQTGNDSKDEISLYVTGDKIRNCKFLEVVALSKVDGIYNISEVKMDGPKYKVTRPLGFQSFGVWAIKPKGEEILLEAHHQCHGLWETHTPMGTWSKK